MKDAVELLDLPDELILAIMKKVNPQVLLLCSMMNIGNNRLQQLAFDRCHSIDLTFDYLRAPHKLLMKRFYSDVLPRIIHNIKSLAINHHHISSIKSFLKNNCNGTLPNLTHLKIMIGAKHAETGIPYTIGKLRLIDFFSKLSLFIASINFLLRKQGKLCHLTMSKSLVNILSKRNLFATFVKRIT
jgi:hypothetical protein